MQSVKQLVCGTCTGLNSFHRNFTTLRNLSRNMPPFEKYSSSIRMTHCGDLLFVVYGDM